MAHDGSILGGRGSLVAVLAVFVLLAAWFTYAGAVPTAAQNVTLSAPYRHGEVPLDPESSEWDLAPALAVTLSGQMAVIPHGGGSVTGLVARALVNSTALSILLEWTDNTKGVDALRTQDFADAAAVQIVSAAGTYPPFVCMGQSAFQTQIWQWRADRDPYAGGGLQLEDVYPNIYADWYPFQNESDFYPAPYVGNVLGGPNETPVQVLVAGGAGTLTETGRASVYGAGTWANGTWRVVFSRPLATTGAEEVPLTTGATFAISFAIWDGNAGDRDGQKSTSTWIDFELSPWYFDPAPYRPLFLTGIAIVGLVVVLWARRRLRGRVRPPKPRGHYSSDTLDELLGWKETPEEPSGRRKLLGLMGIGAAGMAVDALSRRAGAAALAPSELSAEDTPPWPERRKRLMQEFDEGYLDPTHLR